MQHLMRMIGRNQRLLQESAAASTQLSGFTVELSGTTRLTSRGGQCRQQGRSLRDRSLHCSEGIPQARELSQAKVLETKFEDALKKSQ